MILKVLMAAVVCAVTCGTASAQTIQQAIEFLIEFQPKRDGDIYTWELVGTTEYCVVRLSKDNRGYRWRGTLNLRDIQEVRNTSDYRYPGDFQLVIRQGSLRGSDNDGESLDITQTIDLSTDTAANQQRLIRAFNDARKLCGAKTYAY